MDKNDLQLARDVEDELEWDPKVSAASIGVSVDAGRVSLTGFVNTYGEKWAAEAAIRRVSGVRSVKRELKVKLAPVHSRTDAELLTHAKNALLWDVFVPTTVTVSAQSGELTLSGTVAWNYQRDAAEHAVRYLTGVVHVTNDLSLTMQPSAEKVKERIDVALKRQARTDSKSIHVETAGSKVTLTGYASSWQAIDDATSAAWAVAGVTNVVDRLKVSL